VLSFPLLNYETPADFKFLDGDDDEVVSEYFNPDSGELVLGDIIISVEKVKEQSEKFGHSDRRELAFLVAHSMMHLFGYDHMESDEAAVMEKKQAEVLDMLGISR
jgi:probable rRNA maturation factor